MTVHCFTSISFSYLNRARVLGETIKKFHPDWVTWLLISDIELEEFNFNIEDEPWDNVFYSNNLEIDNIYGWMFKHDVVELCTAVKGPFLEWLLTTQTADKVIYLDPDIALFNSLSNVVKVLDQSSIVLTPHQIAYDNEHTSILDNEVSCLIHGTYNLGFIAVKNDSEGKKFSKWWSHRCKNYCYDDKPSGLFVDQKWCDLVPAYFENVHILRDPGYNVASWNLNCRVLSENHDGNFVVNDKYPLRFFHFTKLGPIGDTMTKKYAKNNLLVHEIWNWYKKKIERATDESIPMNYWFYGKFSSNNDIPKESRILYRLRTDVQIAFQHPFIREDDSSFEDWYYDEIKRY